MNLIATFALTVLIVVSASDAAASTERPAPETLALACAGCHNTNGHSKGGTPVIAGKPVADFIRIMGDFKSGRRKSSIMNRIAAGYQQADFAALAQHFATR